MPAIYQRGSVGNEVEKIQAKLKDLGYYLGPIDGIFGGGTESAVIRFQKDNSLLVDGKVGMETWGKLFGGEEITGPDILQESLAYKCLALTGSFETGQPIPECFSALTWDFDGQGMSFGALQWNFGMASLQPLLEEMKTKHSDIMREIFHTEYDILVQILISDYEDQMDWVRSIQDPIRHIFYEPWRGLFKTLGRTKQFQDIQVDHSHQLHEAARSWCGEYDLWSERAVALLFDIKVQNGSIQEYVKAQIHRDIRELPGGLNEEGTEVNKLRIISNRRAEASLPRWIEDVRCRKLCIANGEGTVHGNYFQLESQYGLGLREVQ